MKFSMESALNTADYFQSYLWAVRFQNSEPNIQDSGGSVGKVIPAQSVSEPLWQVTYEDIPVGNGIPVPFPKVVSHLGTVSVTFYDSAKNGEILKIVEFLKKWVTDGSNFHKDNKFYSRKTILKVIEILKYSKESDSHELMSSYAVYPPETVTFSGGTDQSASVFDATFKICHVIKINDK